MSKPLRLLEADEPSPVQIHNTNGKSPIVLVCEHAGKRFPHRLGDLGLNTVDRDRHIAWDIGAKEISQELSRLLDAPLITQTYSRLVCDCNRAVTAESFIPVISETTRISGNESLEDTERQTRIDEIYRPLHACIESEIDDRIALGLRVMLISIHSFTPIFFGHFRPMHIGLLHNKDSRVAKGVRQALEPKTNHIVADNEPYALDDNRDYTIPVHGEQRGIPCLEIEIRQDLIMEIKGQSQIAILLASAIQSAAKEL